VIDWGGTLVGVELFFTMKKAMRQKDRVRDVGICRNAMTLAQRMTAIGVMRGEQIPLAGTPAQDILVLQR